MRTLRVLLVLASFALPACKSGDPMAVKLKLRNYVSERMRKQKFTNIRTDEDSRARKPTKYVAATDGLAYALRHTAKADETPVVIATWVYKGRDERDKAWKGPFSAITDDLVKDHREWKAWPLDIETPELHLALLMDAPDIAVENQFQLLQKLIVADLAELPTTPN